MARAHRALNERLTSAQPPSQFVVVKDPEAGAPPPFPKATCATHSMENQMYAGFEGSLAQGFRLAHIVDAATAQRAIKQQLVEGQLTEMIGVRDPVEEGDAYAQKGDGIHFVLFGSALSKPVEVFGPFDASEQAMHFGHSHCWDDEWEVLELPSTDSASNDGVVRDRQARAICQA